MIQRIAKGYRTWPDAAGWRFTLLQALWLLPLLGLLGWVGDFIRWRPVLGGDTAALLAVAIFFPALAEESLFRAAIIPPQSKARHPWAIMSVLLFTLWHPLQSRIYWVPWQELALDPWFIAAVAALGAACARIWMRTGSIWPCFLLHWSVVASWKAMFGARLVLPHL